MENYNKVIGYLKDNFNTLEEIAREVNYYNGALSEYRWELNDEEFYRTYFYENPMEAVRAAVMGDYNFTSPYVQFDGNGNLTTCYEFQYKDQLIDNVKEIYDTWEGLYDSGKVDTEDIKLKELISNI